MFIIIMYINKNEFIDEFYCEEDAEVHNHKEITLELDQHLIKQSLPANQLIVCNRPRELKPRTLFLDRSKYVLPSSMNESCNEVIMIPEIGKLKLKIVNNQNLSMQQYFLKKKFKCIYNKLQTYRTDNKQFIMRYKSIDPLIDYNQKLFKELDVERYQREFKNQDRVDSDFQGGNVCRAYINIEEEKEFYLLMENDVNTYGYNNWFFFRLKNSSRGVRRFSIVNFIKKTSFYNQGMLVSIFSLQKNKIEGIKWFKGGDKITFNTINFIRDHHQNEYYSCLAFEYNFQYENDQVYFAVNQPYTYSRLSCFIKQVTNKKINNIEVQTKVVGFSISNNIIPVVIFHEKSREKKQIIFILARQHPCETVGSFIAEGIMKLLVDRSQISERLLSLYDFYVIPMVNPDGVIHGTSRCNISGLDLNRQWGQNTIKQLCPETVKIKQFILNVSKQKQIKYMIDLHGHGKKLNSFIFACKKGQKENYRLLSMAMKKLENRFNIYSCTYGVTKDKENTIRAMINSMGILHSYTLETSLFGWKDSNNQIKQYVQEDYDIIASSFLKSVFLLEMEEQTTLRYLGFTRQNLREQMANMLDIIEKEEKINLDNKQILSESDPEGDKLDEKDLLGKCENKLLKKKIQQSCSRNKSKINCSTKLESQKFSSKKLQKTQNKDSKLKRQINSNKELNSKKQIRSSTVKRASFSEKWKEKRKEIVEKKKLQDEHLRSTFENKIMEFIPKSKNNPFNLQKLIPRKISTLKYPKKRIFSHKIKTQIEELNSFTEEEIKQNNTRKSALEMRFKELKEQSLNVLMPDSLSILKITPNHNIKLEEGVKSSKNAPIYKKQHLISEPYSSKIYIKADKQLQEVNVSEHIKFNKFKQFLAHGTSVKKIDKTKNAVFYYFPIL